MVTRTAKKVGTVAEQLRSAILASNLTLNEIRRRSGVDHGVLSRFLRRERDITLEVAARVCTVLGLELVRAQAVASGRIGQETSPPKQAAPSPSRPGSPDARGVVHRVGRRKGRVPKIEPGRSKTGA